MTPKLQPKGRADSEGAAALIRNLATARGAERLRIETEILALGGDAVEPLTKAMRHIQGPPILRVLGAAWIVAAGSSISAALSTGAVELGALGIVIIGAGVMIGMRFYRPERYLNLLLRIDDPRAIPPLVDALPPEASYLPGTAIPERLTYLLPRLSREHARLLPVETRIRLRDMIDLIRDAASMPENVRADFLIAIMKGLVQIGDRDVRLHLVWAREDRIEAVRSMAEKGLAELDRQASEAKK